MRYAYKKQYTWNYDIAYLVGLFASDGCLINDGRHLNITSKDIEIIHSVEAILDLHVKFGIKTSNYNGWGYHLSFSNVALYDFLVGTGLTPAKSLTIGEIDVPDEFYFDFLRGEFDGDGCVRGFKDIRWANSHMFYIEFTSASPVFLQFLRDNNTRLAGTTKGAIHHGKGADTLSYAKKDSMRLAAAMYYPRPLPSLTRKRTKLFGFIKQHQTAIIVRNARVAEW